jgi:hypothetical protein
MNHDQLAREIRKIKNEDRLGWVRYHFWGQPEKDRPWQPMAINRYLERDKFYRNVLPQWIAAALSVLSIVVATWALIVAMYPPKP